ncbi:hypothetical protein FG03878.1 [Paecilomyces variotii No. 5]|uniref:Zn(2)-C6 fungal-type domain-containing protein n=1 Tax=Byssochlamys spectabilis (strain No. 5 / NBRC 109023) TaxID=1356009 RepID=V5FSP5_BYSSN|nr:hypothetical protein FG03878.1 [Paecilomyces variotii No. 5]
MSVRSDDHTSGEDGPARKRSRLRVTRACEACRRRKERCDGGQPYCQRCIKVGRTCSYNQGRKRGLRTGYVRGVEILLGLLIHSFDGAEDLIISILQKEPQLLESSIIDRTTFAISPASLLESWRKSTALENLQRYLTASRADEDEDSYIDGLDVKLTANFNHLPRRRLNVEGPIPDTQPSPTTPEAQTQSPYADFTVRANTQAAAPAITAPDCDTLTSPPLPPNWSHLMDIYMTNTHSWLPILEKYTLFRSASHLDNSLNLHSNQNQTPGEVSSVWAALAHGSYLSEVIGSGHHSSACCSAGDNSFSHIFMVAKKLAMQGSELYEHGHVHACLVLALLDIARGSWNDAWLLVGRAIYVAAMLDIIPFENIQTSVDRNEIGKRLFIGCFILDTLISASLGYRPYLDRADLRRLRGPSSEGLEEWEIWRPVFEVSGQPNFSATTSRALSTFIDLGYLAGILNRLYQIPHQSSNFPQLNELLEDFLQRQKNLLTLNKGPSHLQSHIDSGPYHQVHLRLAAASVYVLLCARIRSISPEAEPPSERVPSSLVEMVRLLESTPKLSPTFGAARMPPTVGIFFHLLERSRLSSSIFPLSSAWKDAEQQMNITHRALGQNDPTASTFVAGMDDVPPILRDSSGRNAMHAGPPSTGQRLTHEPILGLATGSAQEQTLNVTDQVHDTSRSQILNSQSTDHQITSVCDPGSATRRTTNLGTPEMHSLARDEGPGDSRLFNQLSLLHTADL